MRILYIGFFSLPDNDAAANRVINNAKILRELGHEVIFIDEQISIDEPLLNSKHSVLKFDVWSQKRPDSFIKYISKMSLINNYISVINQYEDVSLIIAYNFPSLALLKLIKYAKKNKIKIISDCSEWYSGKEYNFPLDIICAIDSFMRMRIVHKKTNGIICISSFLGKYYKSHLNIVGIPPLVDLRDDIWNQNKCEFEKSKYNLIYAGNPGKQKENLIIILNAINSSRNKNNIVLRIVGVSKEEFIKNNKKSKIDFNYLDGIVIFEGKKKHSETVQLMKSSDYLIYFRPNNRTNNAGFSTKLVEAVTCNMKIITTKTGDVEKINSQLHCIQFANDKKSLIQILDNLEKNQNISCNDFFDYKNYIERFKLFICKITKK